MTGRPRACFDPTIVASSPSTKNEPSSPCDLPTRPMRTASLLTRHLLEELGRLLRRRLRPFAGPLGNVADDVLGPPERNLGSVEQRPVRARLGFVGHSDAAGV